MANADNYNLDDQLPSPCSEMVDQILNSSSIFGINMATISSGINPSIRNSSSSPPQAAMLGDIYPFAECLYITCGNEYPSGYLGTTLPSNDEFEAASMNDDPKSLLPVIDTVHHTSLEIEDEKLRIIAEPKAFYRERYPCEIDLNKNRARRYIRAEYNNKYDYPAVKIPLKWCDPTRQLYIQVTPVTIKSKNISHHFIHPYEIDTQENNSIKEPENNSLYFRIEKNEFSTGEKSFRISQKKMIQNELKSYGPLRLFGSNQFENQSVQNPQSAKQKIAMYQLGKSQLVFTVAEQHSYMSLPVPILHTSVASQIMTDGKTSGSASGISDTSDISTEQILCIPQKSDWQGGDEVVIIMPYPIKQKVFNISFDFGAYKQQPAHEMTYIDRKTILFRTPPCPWLPGDSNFKVSIIITENNLPFPPIDFSYITPIRTTRNTCPRCQGTVTNNHISKKRRCDYYGYSENDSGDQLVSQMTELSLEQKSDVCRPRLSSDEKFLKFEKYLNQLKDALATFVRTNDPSRLFRRTRTLLSDYSGNLPPLNAAIEQGHIQLALSLIEQVMDMPSSNGLLEKANENGETPLLVAAKCNQWTLMKPILEKRRDLVEQKDKDDNNFLHLLANLSEDKGAEMLENALKILPNDTKAKLIKEKNKTNRTAIEIAQSHGNTQCLDVLNFPIYTGEINV